MITHVFNFVYIVLFVVHPIIFDHSNFHCSDSNALEAFNNPTRYCQAQGKLAAPLHCHKCPSYTYSYVCMHYMIICVCVCVCESEQ